MSAELLRRAAALMRERTEAAPPSPWVSSIEGRDHLGGDDVILCGTKPFKSDLYVNVDPAAAHRASMTQDHIASWHPAVALAVADWLDMAADHIDPALALNGGCTDCEQDGAIVLARAYLGEDA